MNKKLLKEIKTYIEESELRDEAEFGYGKNLEALIKENLMPDVYYKIILILNKK